MSVYIKIKEAQLVESPKDIKAILHISSSDNTLKTQPASGRNTFTWNTSMISSSKEKKIMFEIKNQNQNQSYGKGELYFSSLRSHPEKQFSETVTFDNGAQLTIDVFYTTRQNFLGEIAFYNFDKCSSKSVEETNIAETTKQSKRFFETPQKVSSAPKTGLFFCCGDEGDDKLYTVEEDVSHPIVNAGSPFAKQLASSPQTNPTEAVQFYKGPCKSTNVFSCCDAKLQDQKFTVIEDYYRDK